MGVLCVVYSFLVLFIIICCIPTVSSRNLRSSVNSETQESRCYVTLRQKGQPIYEDYVLYNTSEQLKLECIGKDLPKSSNLYWYQTKPSLLLDSNVDEENRFSNADLKHKALHSVELQRKFTNSDNNSQIYCLARKFQGSNKSIVARSKNLTLILVHSNLTYVTEHFHNTNNITSEVPPTNLTLSIDRTPEEKTDSSIFIIIGAVIGVIVTFMFIIGGTCIRNRFKKASIDNQAPQEEPEYATIPDVVQYAKLDLPRNINRELPKIPTEAPYTTIVGKLVPKTENSISNNSNN